MNKNLHFTDLKQRTTRLQLLEQEDERELDRKVLREMERDEERKITECLLELTGKESVSLGGRISLD